MQIGDRERRIEDCGRLYLKYGGKRHELIEREMRELGHAGFHRRIMYSRFERERHRPGWIERYAFLAEPPASAGGVDSTGAGAPAAHADAASTQCGRGLNPEFVPPGSGTENVPVLLVGPTTDAGGSAPVDRFADFQTWLKAVSPGMTWDWEHQVHIYKKLKRVTDGENNRLMIFVPPRHGKSELVTVRYTAWRLKKDPKMNVILASYNQQLANRFSRKIKGVLCDDAALAEPPASAGGTDMAGAGAAAGHASAASTQRGRGPYPTSVPPADAGGSAPVPMFPFVSPRPKNTEAEWETAVGGGLRAVGVGGGVTGFGADLIVIDDPIKSRAQAESQAQRDRVYDWYTDDILTRLEPGGQIILIQTRWHQDDLAGRLLREEGHKWEVVNLPALAEAGNAGTLACKDAKASCEAADHAPPTGTEQTTEAIPQVRHAGGTGVAGKGACVPADPLGRAPGDALCPERFDVPYLNDLKQQIGTYSFASLYQQRPVPAEGGLFKRKWFRDKIVSFAPPGLKWKRGTDPGVSAGEKADYTASYRIAIDHDQNIYIDGGFRKQIEYPELRKFILGRIGAEPDTVHAVELSANGHAIYQDLLKEPKTQGRTLKGVRVKEDKISRALPWLARAEAGKLYLVQGPWNQDLIEELCSFPLGSHDDQVDAISLAYNLATETHNNKLYGFKYR